VPAAAAGVFTENWVKAAPVLLTQQQLQEGRCQAVLVNSGNANACTGKRGMEDAKRLADETARLLKVSPNLVATASTGVIGEYLPAEKMISSLPALCNNIGAEKMDTVARAIMTTDTVPKTVWRQKTIGGKKVVVGGVVKGAGMINPSLATMLGFVLTNAAIKPQSIKALLTDGTDKTFNRITVDSDTSTNDTVLLLANGLAGNQPLTLSSAEKTGFKDLLVGVMDDLAHKILEDGEGVTKLVTVKVRKARSREEAETIARSIADSPLVKTSFYGEEVNWGRIIVAAGKTRFPIVFERLDLSINRVPLVTRGGVTHNRNEKRAQKELTKRSITISLTLNQGRQDSIVSTTDLSLDYVRINAGYKT
jgi:glutamate N-acetyltransferase/amino-acid N-acetyltransferase